MNFTVDWFSQHIPNWTILLSEFKDKPNLHFLEIGSFEGLSTSWLLDNILTDTTSKITCIDPLQDTKEYADIRVSFTGVFDRFKENVLDTYHDKVTLHRVKSQYMLPRLVDTYDFIYIDGSHEAIAALTDAVLSWHLLKSGGIIVFDDYTWYAFKEPTRNPFLGIDAFLSVYRDKIQLLHMGYQVFLRKL